VWARNAFRLVGVIRDLKPSIVEDAIPKIDWIATTFICGNFDGEFNLRPFSTS
jgi:hypothetical protein